MAKLSSCLQVFGEITKMSLARIPLHDDTGGYVASSFTWRTSRKATQLERKLLATALKWRVPERQFVSKSDPYGKSTQSYVRTYKEPGEKGFFIRKSGS